MPNISDSFPSQWIKASDLKGHQVVVTVDRVEFEPVGLKKEMKAVLYFVGKEKGLVLNKTNANKLIEITGSAMTEDWHGTPVVLYPTETQFQGDTVECVRIKAPQKRPAGMAKMTPTPPPVIEDDPVDEDAIPFAWLLPLIVPVLGALTLVA